MEKQEGQGIQRLSVEQVELVVGLFDGYRQFYGQRADLEGARGFLRERLAQEQSVILAYLQEGLALGFTLLYPAFSSVAMGKIWILNDLYVAEEARGRGIGRTLLEGARAFGKQSGAIRLELSTAISNRTAQDLYTQAGWVREEGYYHYELGLK